MSEKSDKMQEITKLAKQAKNRIEQGKYEEGEYFFKRITKLDPSYWQAWQGRGLCFKRMKMYDRAIYCFSKVTTLKEDNQKAWYNLGFCQSQIDEIENALFNLNKSIKLDQNYSIAKIIKAWLYIESNKNGPAQKLLDYVRQNDPTFIESFKNKDPAKEPEDYKIAMKLLNLI